jgi:PadR family transcriptional regulator AphA
MRTIPSTQYALLGSLMNGNRHGYEIMRFLDHSLLPTWHVSTSQLYALLKRLEQDGLVVSTIQAQNSRPSKRIFALTPEGKRYFLEWLRSPSSRVRDLRIEFLAKLFFFHHLSLKGANQLIEQQIEVLNAFQEKVHHAHEAEIDSYLKLAYSFKLATVNAMRDWLKKKAKPFVGGIHGHE